MSVKIYTVDYGGSPVSEDGDMDNPVIFKSPAAGSTIETKFWLRHEILSGPGAESSTGISIDPIDVGGTDENTWLSVANDSAGVPGTYASAGASKSLGDVTLGNLVPFWVKAIVPSNASARGAKDDLRLALTATSTTNTERFSLTTGTFVNCEYSPEDGRINFESSGVWTSDWINLGTITSITEATLDITAPFHYVSYRTSTDGTELNATAWFENVNDLDVSKPYIQIRVSVTDTSVVFDDFNRVDQIPPGVSTSGHTWQPVSGTWGVSSNKLYSTSSGDGEYMSIPYVDSDMYVEATITTLPSSGDAIWLVARYTDANNNFIAGVVGNGQYSIYKRISGSYTLIYNSSTGIFTAGDKLGFSVQGGSLKVYKNDVLQITQTDNTVPLGTNAGVRKNNSNIWRLDDFTVRAAFEQTSSSFIESAEIKYKGTQTYNFDVRIYHGPDTPQLIDPEDGDSTPYFSPELTALVHNADQIEWQFDTSTTFSTANLSQWTSTAVNDQDNVSQPPGTDRPAGTWYWRARSIKSSVAGNWSDYRVLTIIPVTPAPVCMSFHCNVGIAIDNVLDNPAFIPVNCNVGNYFTPLDDPHIMYLHGNVELGTGIVIYPIQDDTYPAKLIFGGAEDTIS